jgi:hypothetical protein
VKIYLLLANDEQLFFYSDDTEADESREDGRDRSSGSWGCLLERWLRFQKTFHEADAGVARWARRSWDWLHSLAHPDETMLARLRSARRIDLHHPSCREASEVASIWSSYLSQRFWRHQAFAFFNSLLAVPTILFLWPLPGPNVIGYWFVYRTVHHLLIVRGIRSVRKGWTPTMYHPSSALDLPAQGDGDGRVIHSALGGEGGPLETQIDRSNPAVPITSPETDCPSGGPFDVSKETRSP